MNRIERAQDWLTGFVTPLRHWRHPVRRGRLEDGSGVTLIGESLMFDEIARRIGVVTPKDRPVHCTTASLPGIAMAARGAGDLVLARLPRRLPMLPDALRLPELVGATIEVEEVMRRRRRNKGTVRTAQRQLERSGLEAVPARDAASFDLFHETMYLPFIDRRFGAGALKREAAALRKRYARGLILFMRGPDGIVGGTLLEIEAPALHLLVYGSTLSIEEARNLGFAGIANLFAADHAKANGLRRLDMGGSLPLRTDSRLRTKLQWGGVGKAQRFTRWDIAASWAPGCPAAARFTALEPVFRPGGGHLAVLTPKEGEGSPGQPDKHGFFIVADQAGGREGSGAILTRARRATGLS